MKIFITGSHGFIGRRLTEDFSRRHEVYSADIAGEASATHHFIGTEREDLTLLIERIAPDVCINCAGAADVSLSFEDPARDFSLNVDLVRSLLEAIRTRSPTTRFINMSSAAVYGNPARCPVTEETPANPISPYGWHKLLAEAICREYADCFGVQSVSLRLFSVFGPGLRKQLYWDVFQKALRSDKIVCKGTGDETRDYIFVQDVVGAVDAVIAGSSFSGNAINVASGQSTTIRDAVQACLGAIDWKGTLVFDGEGRGGDPLHWQADISKLSELGYSSTYDYHSGIRELAEWLKTLR